MVVGKITGTFFVFIIFWLVFSSSTTAQDKSVVGEWSDPIALDVLPVAVSNLPNGKLIVWSASERDFFYPNDGGFGPTDGFTYTELFDPFLGQDGQGLGEDVTNLQHDMFCPGINNLPNGNILSAGGTSNFKTSIYDYKNNTWIADADMNIKRAYQGNVTLSNGDIFTWGGSWSEPIGVATSDKNAEVWNPITGWTEIPGLDGDMLFNAQDLATEPDGVYRADNHAWLWPAPNGELFHAGPGEIMHWVDITAGTAVPVGTRNGDTNSMKGTTVMFDTGKLLKIGGAENYADGAPAKNNSLIIDINGAYGVTPTVTNGGNLNFSRTMHNSTVLPNGDVMVTGGLDNAATFSDYGARLTAEIFTEGSGWRNVAGMAVPRTYHSVSILLPDGRVFAGGGGLCVGCFNHYDAEIYSPPYLFESDGSYAERPFINAPETANYNTTINVTGSTGITEMSLIRFSAATHSTNNEQRRIPITTIVDNGANYDITIPGSNLLPPGYYMLFAIDANGVPSIAETIQIADNTITSVNPCDGTSLVPQLSISGTPSIGDDFILLTGGENLTALTATGPGTKTITLPNGTVVTDNYAIGTMDATKEGWYTIENNLGCFTRVKIALETPDIPLCTTTTNLALGKFAEQSSTYAQGTANIPLDGNVTGTNPFGTNADLQHTTHELSPWWQVDLEAMANIEEVIIYNRQSENPLILKRLADFYVFTSDLPFSKTATLQEIFTDPNVENHYYGGTVNGSATITIGKEARYLRVQFLSDGLNNRVMHMAEVQVMGCSTAPTEPPCQQPPVVSISTVGPFIENDSAQILNASPLGGTWSGVIDANGTFDPSIAGIGTHIITYSFTDGNGCIGQDNIAIIVNPDEQGTQCQSPINLALQMTTEQSSTYGDGNPNLAVDGNLAGTSPWTPDLQHTMNEENPWWQVDLGAIATIEQVHVLNRTSGQQHRLNNFYIFASQSPFPVNTTLQQLVQDTTVQKSFFPGIAGVQENIQITAQARYVRIQILGTSFLHMAEVQVMGCSTAPTEPPCQQPPVVSISTVGPFIENDSAQILNASPLGGTWSGVIDANGTFDPSIAGIGTHIITYSFTDGNGCIGQDNIAIIVNPDEQGTQCQSPINLALQMTTEQSSTYGDGNPNLAVDGNLAGTSPWTPDLQHTMNEENPWWQVDLGAIATIEQVHVLNRTSGQQHRLNNFYIFASQSPFPVNTTLQQLVQDTTVQKSFFPGIAGVQENIQITAQARYVRIQILGTSILHMAEVQVMGCSTAPTEPCQQPPVVSISTVRPFIENDSAQTLNASPLGGTWSGVIDANGTFDPSIAGIGTHNITYSFTDGNGCIGQDNIAIIVNPDEQGTQCQSPINLALQMTTEQSSTYGDGNPNLAVDGNLAGTSPWTPDLQHTMNEENPWWQVDLGAIATIEQVHVLNRTSGQQHRLNNFYIFASQSPFPVNTTLQQLVQDTTVQKSFFPGIAGVQENIQITAQARYVRIQILGTSFLHMAEVQVMGCLEESPSNLMANLDAINTDYKNQYSNLKLSLFPNPTNNFIKYKIENTIQTNWNVQIFNFSNQNVLNQKNKDNQGTISVTHLSNGFYTIIFNNNEDLISSTFIVLK